MELVCVNACYYGLMCVNVCVPLVPSAQGLAVFLVFTVLNAEVQEVWKLSCLGRKSPNEDAPRAPQNPVSMAHTHTHTAGSLEV